MTKKRLSQKRFMAEVGGPEIKLGHEAIGATHCEMGCEEKKKPFLISWEISQNKASEWYCANRPVRQGKYWRLCKEHWGAVGEKGDWGEAEGIV